jgi:alpha-L-rhamnosidase
MRVTILKTLFAVIGCAMISNFSQAGGPQAPTGLLCELRSNPVGIEDLTPDFSWIVNDPDPEEVQSAYQVQVASDVRLLEQGKADVWDSQKVQSSESSCVTYAGPALSPASVYYWRVRTWDKDGTEGVYSPPAHFVTAIRDGWKAEPVWAQEGDFVLLRKSIILPAKKIRHAFAFVSGRSTEAIRQYVFRFYLNGKFVGVGPARGYNGKVPYNVFDLTDAFKSGTANTLAAICCSKDKEKDFLCQINIRFEDGSEQIITTGSDWKAMNADSVFNMPKRFFHYYQMGAEHLNAQNLPAGWMESGFDDAHWQNAVVKPAYTQSLFAQPIENLYLVERAPAELIDKGNGHYYFDFGKEIVASMRLTLEGQDGQTIQLRLAEELEGPQTPKYKARTAVTYDETWTLRKGKQSIENFGYRGFRYGEILNAPHKLDKSNITALVLQYPFDDDASGFTSSEPLLNEIWELCRYSIKATNIDLYQDCPTRERGPYEGDAWINQLSHYAVDRDFAFARYTTEYLLYRPTWPTEYKPAMTLMAWDDYMATGSGKLLEEHYDILKTKTPDGQMQPNGLHLKKDNSNDRVLVDWPASYRDGYHFTEYNTVVNAFNYKSLELLARIAEVLQRPDEAEQFRKKADQSQHAINTLLLDAERRIYKDGYESTHSAAHANFFPAAFGLVPAENRRPIAEFLIGKGMACSVYGAQFMLDALYNLNRGDAALDLMLSKETHSWYHMLHNLNATIVTEAWDPSGKPNMSYAHPWASAPVNVIPRQLFGIQPTEPGYRKFQVTPQAGSLKNASIDVPTIRGTIKASFQQDNQSFELELTVPVNTTASVRLPSGGPQTAEIKITTVGRKDRVDAKRDLIVEDGYVLIENVGSGTHRFFIGKPAI